MIKSYKLFTFLLSGKSHCPCLSGFFFCAWRVNVVSVAGVIVAVHRPAGATGRGNGVKSLVGLGTKPNS